MGRSNRSPIREACIKIAHLVEGVRGSYRTMRATERLNEELIETRKTLASENDYDAELADCLSAIQTRQKSLVPESLFDGTYGRIATNRGTGAIPSFRCCFPDETAFAFVDPDPDSTPAYCWRHCDAVVVWGIKPNTGKSELMRHARNADVPLFFTEDGFLKSVNTAAADCDPKWKTGISMTADCLTSHYDGTRPSTLERWLNSDTIVSEEERREARKWIDFIVENRLTKYNHQPIYEPAVGSKGRKKVLVVDQSYGDFSVRRGLADEQTFEYMLRCAVEENPDADILVKTHPDTLAGRGGYFTGLPKRGNVIPITFPINPISLLLTVDRVYVVSSQFGFEALMCGKNVSVFGLPFYSNWGLTDDRLRCPRRTQSRSLEEVFAMAYMRYSHYCNPQTGRRCGIEEALHWLLEQRAVYHERHNTRAVA